MVAYVAFAHGAQECVDEGVKGDIGVAVSDQASIMGNAHPAEPEVVARAKCVDVEAECRSADHRRLHQQFRGFEILVIGQLLQSSVTGNTSDVQACASSDLRIVGGCRGIAPLSMSGKDEIEPEGLRSLDTKQLAAVGLTAQKIRAMGERIGHREHRNRAIRGAKSCHQAIDDLGREERACSIMDEDVRDILPSRGQSFKAVPDGLLPRRSAGDRRREGPFPERFPAEHFLPGAGDQLNVVDSGMVKTVDRVRKNALGTQLAILFRQFAAEPDAAACSHQQCHRPSHRRRRSGGQPCPPDASSLCAAAHAEAETHIDRLPAH